MQTVDEVLRQAFAAHVKNDWPEAERLYCSVIAHAEDHPSAYFMLGTLYAQAQAPGRALTFLKRSLELDGSNYEAMQNLAGVYRMLENRDKSVEWNEKSLLLNRNPNILNNLAGCYINQGEPQKALDYADEALSLKPDFPEAGNHRALALLELGRWAEGWAQYDSRMDCVARHEAGTLTQGRYTRRPYTVPMWKGEPVNLLAIHGEQGLGDEIMFLTCLRQVLERYQIGKVVIECNGRLVKLLENSLGVKCYATHDELVANEKPDAYIPMGSLPRFIWPVVPNAYLKPTRTIERGSRMRIGVSWFGGSFLTHMALRNAPLAHWKPLLNLDAEFVSLQYGPRADEAAQLGTPHDEAAIADLDHLAALIKSCDLVVTVCNTTVHMAGALGVPCLCMVPSKPAWRYGLTGDKMVWYDSVTMIRQGKNEEWDSVIRRTRQAIIDLGRIPGTEQKAARIASRLRHQRQELPSAVAAAGD